MVQIPMSSFMIQNLKFQIKILKSVCVTRSLFLRTMALYNLGGMRKPYNDKKNVFTEDQLVSNEPVGQFSDWFDEARNTPEILEANAMCIATATKEGAPSVRVVLLKGFSKDGFSFYTRYNSRKGKELEENPKASLCFFWPPLNRTVRIEGDVERVSEKDSSGYFDTRPRGSRIAAVTSCRLPPVLSGRDQMVELMNQIEKEYEDQNVPRPKEWGGYLIVPKVFEFWQGQSNRSHDRIVFRRRRENEVLDPKLTKEGADGWLIERIAP